MSRIIKGTPTKKTDKGRKVVWKPTPKKPGTVKPKPTPKKPGVIKVKPKMQQIKDRLDRENWVKSKVRTKALTKASKKKKVA